ncbi:(d)CMP kinase [Collinsella sp. AGMB00827]|uniref:Cytidylate kinase n=1 Tax=Collinsella ureilytica TaxID=2869515 RepID=A0ABS7MNP2_9ACTN|nr:(d)CMP kinase [Collinsella urealyticum]MBY4798020.1 (d)CMP kinase [Collinsella urealyticum]
MIIAIDGPAGSGKSTLARELAHAFGFEKLDTGALYRALAYTCLREGIDLHDPAAIEARAQALTLIFDGTGEETRITADGQDVSEAIRTPEVDRAVSCVAILPGVRQALLPAQRRFAEGRNVVAEGRDIGTVVFPQAELKVYLDADPHIRAVRRLAQREAKQHEQIDQARHDRDLVQTQQALEARDAADAQNMQPAEDAIRIDSSSKSIDELVHMIGELISGRRSQ